MAKAKKANNTKKKPIEQYDHKGKKRVNNPPVGLVTPQTDKESGKKTYAYFSHLDPQLVWTGKAELTSFEMPTFLPQAMLVVPLAPKKSVEIKFAEADDGRRHLALKRLAAHLAVGHNFQADTFLHSDGIVNGAIFDCFELSSSDCSGGELLLRVKQFCGPKQDADDVGMSGKH